MESTALKAKGLQLLSPLLQKQLPLCRPVPAVCPDLLEGGLQLLLPLLCLLQHRLPARVQLLQAVPQAAGIVPCAGLQELVACFVHRLHGCLVGQDIVLQHLHETRWANVGHLCKRPVTSSVLLWT